MRKILVICLLLLSLIPTQADEVAARCYQDVACATLWAADEELRSFVLGTEQLNELLLLGEQEGGLLQLPGCDSIIRVLARPEGGWLIAARAADGTSRLLTCTCAADMQDVSPAALPRHCVPIRFIEREARSYLLVQGGDVPSSTADIYLVDIAVTPATCTLLHRGEAGMVSQIFRHDGSRMASLCWNAEGCKHIHYHETADKVRSILSTGAADRLQLISANGEEKLYVLHDMGQEGAGLAELYLSDGKLQTISSSGRADVTYPFFGPSGELLGYCSQWGKGSYTAFQSCPAIEELQRILPSEAEFVPLKLSTDGQRLLLQLMLAGQPSRPALYERGIGLRELMPPTDIPPTRPTLFAEYLARDGASIPVYYTLPEGEGPFPTVVFVHGGPRMRTDALYDWRVQYLVSQGFAVVQPQFRGSRGWGKAFMHAGNRQWGRGCMQTDVQDCLPWLEQQGIARAGNVAVFGGSYGGYAVTAALCFFPGSFACGVSLFGPQDMELYLLKMNEVEAPYAGEDFLLVGDISTPEGRAALRHISPVYYAANVTEPLLIYYGERDTLIPPAHSQRMIAALRAAGKDVTAVSLPDEAHGFEQPAHEPWLYARHIVPFLRKHLKQKHQP